MNMQTCVSRKMLIGVIVSVVFFGISLFSRIASAQTLQELGWVNFSYGYSIQGKGLSPKDGTTMWVPSKAAFRTADSVQDDTIYVDDNAFMGWAMSKNTLYSWSANQYASAIRNYIISMTADSSVPLKNNGTLFYTPTLGPEFYKGHVYVGGNWVFMVNDKNTDPNGSTYPKMPNGSDSAIISFAPSLAMVSITIAYPTFVNNGVDNTSWLYTHIDRILSHQNEIVLNAPSISSGEDKRLSTASMAMHMLASIQWFQFRNDQKYLTFAKNAWNKIKLRQNMGVAAPSFKGVLVDYGNPDSAGGNYSVLRHSQILAAMTHTFRVIGDYNGLDQAMINASNALKIVGNPVSCGSWVISQGFYLGNNPCAQDGDGGLGYASFYREQTITDAFAYLGQLCHNSPLAQTSSKAFVAAKRSSVNSGYITGDFFNTFVGNRTITNGLFTENSPSEVANDPLFIGGTLEGNAMVWLAKWWQTQTTGC